MTTHIMYPQRFNVVDYIHKLRKASFTQEQAETIAQETELVIESILEQGKQTLENKELATRGNILELELKIEKVKSELEINIEKSRNELIRWVLGTGVGTVLALAGLLKCIPQ